MYFKGKVDKFTDRLMWGIEREVKDGFKDFGPDGQMDGCKSIKMKTENPFGFSNIKSSMTLIRAIWIEKGTETRWREFKKKWGERSLIK